ncbi:hypothetical protein [Nostoc sp.]|uniref:hypothetical protein n=1 Tax=Nostoc sp. TaxID=1180 RepID=UPI002FF8CEA3
MTHFLSTQLGQIRYRGRQEAVFRLSSLLLSRKWCFTANIFSDRAQRQRRSQANTELHNLSSRNVKNRIF